ncbi:hypothetical protein IJM16_01230 [Candidatus Saccharibacteria bacterium]|nr:hypothetical protein [Candidatus Saccharibacteria bacterium]
MAKRRLRIRKWPIVFFALLAISGGTYIVSGTLAKMQSVIPDKSSELSVAAWNVAAEMDEKNIMAVAGGSDAEYPLTVTNNSEVASECIITVSGVPDGIGVKLTGDGLSAPIVGQVNDDVVVFKDSGDSTDLLLGKNASRDYVIHFTADVSMNATTNPAEIAVEVEFAQKDPRL